jgi:hypothetical protein
VLKKIIISVARRVFSIMRAEHSMCIYQRSNIPQTVLVATLDTYDLQIALCQERFLKQIIHIFVFVLKNSCNQHHKHGPIDCRYIASFRCSNII